MSRIEKKKDFESQEILAENSLYVIDKKKYAYLSFPKKFYHFVFFQVATGIGVTPFSSILQSIIFRYKAAQRVCPNCNYKWVMDLSNWMQQLKKVDFFWINRDQNSFEWFLKLLLEIENEQSEIESSSQQVCPEDKNLQGDGRFMNIHLYFTQALQSSDIRAVGMQLAMDLLRTKVLF